MAHSHGPLGDWLADYPCLFSRSKRVCFVVGVPSRNAFAFYLSAYASVATLCEIKVTRHAKSITVSLGRLALFIGLDLKV
jgi:hypothetical protein